ncbi:hypothetical protein, unlikely [Trypanosoma brucei gambiense DAL972]|uniref:Uncharacterized protein n=1 Tax=Trypanosoma brucei gambiense (strain MHOM/CI/86/DAL972) TaxID=679716 RepID=D0A5D1_TRYB9|nr:hypothetical protein, unlikely [Trypanosoma brucei gambiense DAL972]CBH16475.1 hypothetical protein, unlikely [Trypanosoma brucei gambiense DAL972]|eukprot:XP_011778739.1 hypothetical protein, unlikely [Trypanosoma brucei gambiense DAL972]
MNRVSKNMRERRRLPPFIYTISESALREVSLWEHYPVVSRRVPYFLRSSLVWTDGVIVTTYAPSDLTARRVTQVPDYTPHVCRVVVAFTSPFIFMLCSPLTHRCLPHGIFCGFVGR